MSHMSHPDDLSKSLKPEECRLYEKKTIEFWKAADLLIGKGMYNAASTRLYYSLIHLGLRNAAKYQVKQSNYMIIVNGKPKVNKSAIEQNPVGLKIKDSRKYKVAISMAKACRVKADYYSPGVVLSEIEVFLPDLRAIITREGIVL